MKDVCEKMKKLRAYEQEIAVADPKRVAKLTAKIARLKMTIFDK